MSLEALEVVQFSEATSIRHRNRCSIPGRPSGKNDHLRRMRQDVQDHHQAAPGKPWPDTRRIQGEVGIPQGPAAFLSRYGQGTFRTHEEHGALEEDQVQKGSGQETRNQVDHITMIVEARPKGWAFHLSARVQGGTFVEARRSHATTRLINHMDFRQESPTSHTRGRNDDIRLQGRETRQDSPLIRDREHPGRRETYLPPLLHRRPPLVRSRIRRGGHLLRLCHPQRRHAKCRMGLLLLAGAEKR